MAESILGTLSESIEEKKRKLAEKMEKQMLKRLHSSAYPMKELMAFYRCAQMEMETKFRVLDEQFSLTHDRNPIESISSRLKTLDHIYEKAKSAYCGGHREWHLRYCRSQGGMSL